MTQDHITRFNVHFAGKTTSQQADSLQPLLRSAKDDAYPELISYKARKRTPLAWLCWLILIASAAHILFSEIENSTLDIAAWVAIILTSLTLLLLPSLKTRRFRDYRAILEKHQ